MNPATLILAIDATNALITVATNSLLAAQKYQTLIATARAEGRDITEAEINELRVANQDLTADVLSMLQGVDGGDEG
jgi:hypothetical protein